MNRLTRAAAQLSLLAAASLAAFTSLSPVTAGAAPAGAAAPAAGAAPAGVTGFSLTPARAQAATGINGDNQGFSVETADLARGALTKALLARPLRELGHRGVIRIGGYTGDLVWPAFGAGAGEPAPAWAIAGTVDQADLDSLRQLTDATGWQVSISVPVAPVIAGEVSYSQAVAEVVAAHNTLGASLQGIEIGNEYNIQTSLSVAGYYSVLKTYYDDITAALPGAGIKVIGPSSTGSPSLVSGFVSALAADPSVSNPRQVVEEVTDHHYDGGGCGLTAQDLLSQPVYTSRQATLSAEIAATSALGDGMPFVMNETNSTYDSGCDGVGNSYAEALWSLDYLLQATQAGVTRLNFHTSTADICGDFHPSSDAVAYTTTYRWYAAFCASSQAALTGSRLSAAPLYDGIWAFRQLPAGTFTDLAGSTDDSRLRAYGIESRNGTLTVVLINVQDSADAAATSDAVTLHLPAGYRRSGSAQTLKSSDPAGLASTDAAAITLGGRHALASGGAAAAAHHTAVAVRAGAAAITVAPATAQIVTFAHVQLPGEVAVTGLAGGTAGLLTAGQANPVTVSVANTNTTARQVTATVAVPAGWSAGSVTATVPASGQAQLTVPVTPPAAPTQANLTAQLSTPQDDIVASDASLAAVTAPPAAAVSLALDAGTTTSPVYAGYTALTPDSVWADGQQFGWVGTPPQSRDRGGPDDLRRDLVASTSPATLRLAVPAGVHQAWILVGDPGFAADPVTVSSGGQTLAAITTPLPAGTYQWLSVPLDGGSSGQPDDLTFTGAAGQFWVVDAVVVQ